VKNIKSIALFIIYTLTILLLTACAGTQTATQAPTPTPESCPEPSPVEVIFEDPVHEPEDAAPVHNHVEEELIAFVLRAEKVFRDIVLGDLFSGHYDEESEEWVWSEHVEEAPDFWVDTPEGPYQGWDMMRWRVLPSSGYSSIADLNAAVHEYWSEDFNVSSESIHNESIDYAEIDGELYFFPAGASGIGDSFLGVIWELAQFELLQQTDDYVTLRADVYLTSYADLYRSTIQWEIADGKIIKRDIEFGEHILWRDFPEAIDAMVKSGRWTENHVAYNWESGWFDDQVLWE